MKKRKLLARIVLFLVGLAIIVALVVNAGSKELLEALQSTSLVWVVISTIVGLVAWVFRALLIQLYSSLKFKESFRIIVIGYALNSLLPAKAGDISIIYNLKKKGIALKRSITTVIHYRVMDLWGLMVLVLPLAAIYLNQQIPGNVITYLIVIGIVLAIPILMLLDRKGFIVKFLAYIEEKLSTKMLKKVVNVGNTMYSDYKEVLKKSKIRGTFFSMMHWFIEGVAAYLISIAVGYPIVFPIIFLAITLGNITKSIPTTPGGLGVYETTTTIVLGIFGVPVVIATLIAILDHGIKNLVGMLIGAFAMGSLTKEHQVQKA